MTRVRDLLSGSGMVTEKKIGVKILGLQRLQDYNCPSIKIGKQNIQQKTIIIAP